MSAPTLAEWMLACIAEDEAVARAAIGSAIFQTQTGAWSFEHVGEHALGSIPIVFALADRGGKTQVARLDEAWESEERGAHIARHDPARVLAQCEAHRDVVRFHMSEMLEHCQEGCPGIFPCRTLRTLAMIYADRLGYEEWA